MYYDPDHNAAFAVDSSTSILAAIRDLIGLPAGDNSGGVLITSIEQAGLVISTIERAANARRSDIILGRFIAEGMSAAPPLFAVAVRLHWTYLWHMRFQLWLPRTGEPAVFVPVTPQGDPCFRIYDGRLFADNRMPFASIADRERGILDAHAVLCSPMRAEP